MYKVTVNGKYKHEVSFEKDHLLIDKKSTDIDIVELKKGSLHIIKDNKSYTAELVSMDEASKTCIVTVNGNPYTVELKDRFDELLHQLGMDNLNSSKINEIKAPMPGLVLKVLVTEGQEIKKGDGLVVLEAMKMENILKSPADVVIKSIRIKPGDKVEKNQVLLQLN